MFKFPTMTILILITFSNISFADVLIIDRIQKSPSINVPNRGATMEQVLSEFGEPEDKKGPIGTPPITVWKYSEFSVYFEKSWVINSVINKSSPDEKGPKPINK